MSGRSSLTWRLLGIGIALVVWEIAGRLAGDELLAPPTAIVAEYPALIQAGMPLMLASSLEQMFVGFFLACLIGMPLGIAMGRSRAADLAFHPWVSMLVVTSTAALVPLFILIFGTDFSFRVALVFVASAFYIALTAYQGARGIDARLLAVGRSFSASRLQAFRMILLPALFPYLVTGARIGLVHAIRAMVMAEMFVIIGFGGLVHQSGLEPSTAQLLGLLLTIMAVSVALNALLRLAGRRFAPWYDARTG